MPTIEVSEEALLKIKEQFKSDFEEVTIKKLDDLIGGKYFFRGVTYHLVGKVEKRVGDFLELSDASWIADSGRFMNAIKDGSLSEVEPIGRAYINIKAVMDFFPWKHDLPTEQK